MQKRLKIFLLTMAVLCSSTRADITSRPVLAGENKSPAVSAQKNDRHVEITFPAQGTLSINIFRSPYFEETVEIRRQTRKLFAARDFNGLEELGARLCADKRSFPNGGAAINIYFLTLQSLRHNDSPDTSWEEQLQELRDWEKAKPNSILAKIALMNFWTTYAWKARGDGWADSVSQEGWKLFSARLAKAQTIVAEAAKLPQICPYLYREELILARGNSWEPAAMEEVFRKSEEKFPNYLSSYTMKYAYLMPRWGGEPGACDEFFARSADKHGKGKEADKFYARLIWNLDALWFVGWPIFCQTNLSWSRTKSGFEAMLKDDPNSITIMSEFAKLANYADDKQITRALFRKLGNTCDPSVWSSFESLPQAKWYFTQAREKAFSNATYKDQKSDE